MKGQKIWGGILMGMKPLVSSSTFKTWFAGSYVLDFKNEQERKLLIVALRNNFQKEQIESRYLPMISEVTQQKLKEKVDVVFVVSQKQQGQDHSREPIFSGIPRGVITNTKSADNLNPGFTFENFVVGPSNNLAFLAAKQAASNPGSVYNPLLIYGPTGVGKTHLLQACANEIIENVSNAKVIYVSAEKFTNEFIGSLGEKSQPQFRNKYRKSDVLIVDDVQFLAGKESTQDEFFYTFNELLLSGKQVIMASDKHPKDCAKLKERLVGRFLSGMTADVALADFELKVGILKSKCITRRVEISDETIEYIAQNSSGGARELEGALISVLAKISLSGKDVSFDEMRNILKSNTLRDQVKPSKEFLLHAVCEYFKIRESDILSPSRRSGLVLPRQVLMYLLREDLCVPYEEIGRVLGGKDHSTVIYSVNKIRTMANRDKQFADQLFRIKLLLPQDNSGF